MFSGRYCTGDEAHQAPLYYLTLAAWQRLAGVPAKPPYSGKARLGTTETSEGFEVHHSSSDHQFLFWLRLPNVLLGALTVLFAFFAVKLVSSDPWTPVVGASIVAFLPRFVFLSSFVTNDNLVDLLGATLTLTALRYARAPNRWRMAVVGAIVGLLVLTKLSVLPIGLVLVALPLMARDWRTRAEYFGVGVLSTLVVSSWYLIQNTVRYGDPLALAVSTRYLTQVGAVGSFFWTPYRVSNWMSLIVVHVPERILDSFGISQVGMSFTGRGPSMSSFSLCWPERWQASSIDTSITRLSQRCRRSQSRDSSRFGVLLFRLARTRQGTRSSAWWRLPVWQPWDWRDGDCRSGFFSLLWDSPGPS